MPSETFYCPHCKTQLTKTAQQYVLGETQNSYFICFGQLPPNVICAACNEKIDMEKMIKGEYDILSNSVFHFTVENAFIFWMMMLCFLGSVIASIWLLQVQLDWMWFFAWFTGILIGYIFAVIVGSILVFLGNLLTVKK